MLLSFPPIHVSLHWLKTDVAKLHLYGRGVRFRGEKDAYVGGNDATGRQLPSGSAGARKSGTKSFHTITVPCGPLEPVTTTCPISADTHYRMACLVLESVVPGWHGDPRSKQGG
jgi:hypothetical protein